MLRDIVNIQDAPVAGYPLFSQPDGRCVLGYDEFLVEIKCPFTGLIPKIPSDEYLVQCQVHLEAHNMEKCLLIFYTPTSLIMYVIYRSVSLWNILSTASRQTMEYVREKNLFDMGYRGPPGERNEPDSWMISRAISKYIQYDVIFQFIEGYDFSYDSKYFGELTIPTVQERISIKNL